MADSKVRQRKGADKENGVKAFDAAEGAGAEPPVKPASEAKTSKSATKKADKEDEYSPWVDVLRVLTFLMVASCGLSYLVSGGDSWVWGLKHSPQYFQVNYWKSRFVRTTTTRLSRISQRLADLARHSHCPFTSQSKNSRPTTGRIRPSPSTSPSTGPFTTSRTTEKRTDPTALTIGPSAPMPAGRS